MKSSFTKLLMQWHLEENTRQMPWKGEKDPYKIWLSEIILQQTRVEQGWKYYENFIHKYPVIEKLAKAKDEEVFKLWEGLGYYNRCKNLLHTARFITNDKAGVFPDVYEDILQLKGVGPYTAAAIASFAFNKPYAVVDGNVFRVLARVFGKHTPIDSGEGKVLFTKLAQQMIDLQQPALYNQAIMDFGAVVCKPAIPLCHHCPLQKICTAYKEGWVHQLPVKEKVLQKKNRWLYYFIFECNGKILVHKRTGNDIWQNLFEFYLVETGEQVKWNEEKVASMLYEQLGISDASIVDISPLQKQQLTHQQIKGQFIKVQLNAVPDTLQHYEWTTGKGLQALAFPKFINQYLSIKNTGR